MRVGHKTFLSEMVTDKLTNLTDELTLKSRSPLAKAQRTERSVIGCRRCQAGARQGSGVALLIDSLNGQSPFRLALMG
jgi:hypothetical protein